MSIKTDHIFFACMLFFIVALSSCTKEIDYKGNETDPLLIVEASLEPNMWYDKRDNMTYYGKLYFTVQSTQFFLDTAKNSLLFEDICIRIDTRKRAQQKGLFLFAAKKRR